MTSKWETIGSIRRCYDGLWISLVDGSEFAISSADAPSLIVEGKIVPLYQLGEVSAPFRCGEAYWSESGRMIVLAVPGACRAGKVMVSGKHIAAHYLRDERRAVPVVRAPAPGLPKGVTMAVV